MLRRIATLCCVGLLASAASLRADTLHGFCWGTSSCTDAGPNTPVATNPPDFGFAGSGNSYTTGDLILEFLVPNNAPSASSLSITVDNTTTSTNTTASLSDTLDWSSGALDDYLAGNGAEPSTFAASPNNPIGAYLDSSETALDSGATGFYVYQDNLGSQTIGGTGTSTQEPDLSLLAGLPKGSYITAYLVQGTDYADASATAPSGALLLTGTPAPGVPEPSSLLLLGTGIVGLAGMLRRRVLPAGNLG